MEWKPPEFIEIDMNAEIGAYQQETVDGAQPKPRAPADADTATAPAADSPARQA